MLLSLFGGAGSVEVAIVGRVGVEVEVDVEYLSSTTSVYVNKKTKNKSPPKKNESPALRRATTTMMMIFVLPVRESRCVLTPFAFLCVS